MRALQGLTLAAMSCLPLVVQAALPEPPLNGVVVRDRTIPFSLAFHEQLPDTEPTHIENAYRGTVQQRVIRESDGTYDFYFRITSEPGSFAFSSFGYSWPGPATTYSVAHSDARLVPLDPTYMENVGPPVGAEFVNARGAGFNWSHFDPSGLTPDEARMFDAVIVLDTDARAFADTGGYQLSANGRFYSTQSPVFSAFAPAVPEPETYALMLAGLGVLAVLGRRRGNKLQVEQAEH